MGRPLFSPTSSSKDHLNAEQTPPRKAAHCLQKEVGPNIKDRKRDKRVRGGDPSQEGSLSRGSFQTPENPLTGRSGGSF